MKIKHIFAFGTLAIVGAMLVQGVSAEGFADEFEEEVEEFVCHEPKEENDRMQAFNYCARATLPSNLQTSFNDCRKSKPEGFLARLNKSRCVDDLPRAERNELFECVRSRTGDT